MGAPLSQLSLAANSADVIAVFAGPLPEKPSQDYLEGSANTAITSAEFASQAQLDNGAARNGIDIFFENYDIDVVVSKLGQAYATAGYPALTVPAGYAEDGTPTGVVFTGLRLSEPQLLAVGYAYEQASQARVAPDLEATMALLADISWTPPRIKRRLKWPVRHPSLMLLKRRHWRVLGQPELRRPLPRWADYARGWLRRL